MNLKTFKADVFDDKTVNAICTSVIEPTYKKIFDNKHLVDTAGFVPLNVRIKQFLLSGEQAKLNSEMFYSDDWRYMFDHINENTLEVGDDIEDVNRKLAAVVARKNELLMRKGIIQPIAPDKPSDDKQSDKGAGDESAEGNE